MNLITNMGIENIVLIVIGIGMIIIIVGIWKIGFFKWLKEKKEGWQLWKKAKNFFVKSRRAESNWPYNLIVGFILLAILALVLALVFLYNWITDNEKSDTVTWVIVVGTTYFLASIRIVRGDVERAGIILFGYVVNHVVDSGLVIVPVLVGRLETIVRQVIQKELPDEPEKVWSILDEKGHEKPIPPEKREEFKDPIRALFSNTDPDEDKDSLKKEGYNFNGLSKEEKDDPLRKRLTIRITPVMRFRVSDVIRFLKTFGSLEAAIRQLEDKVISDVTAILQEGTYARALANMSEIGKMTTHRVIESLYIDTGFKEVTLPEEVTLYINGEECRTKTIKNESLFGMKLSKRAEFMAEGVAKYWGITILPVQLKPFGTSRVLNLAIQSIAEGRATALAEKEKAVGIQASTAATFKGVQEGLKDISPKERLAVLSAKVLEQGMKKGTVIISSGPNGLMDLTAQVTATQEAMAARFDKKEREK